MTLSLESFLSTHQLDHYYTSFLEAGATDHDLSHLVQLNDQELSEFLLAMDMLPFHAIKLKKALREFRASYRSPPQSTAHVDDSSVLVPLIDETENDKRSTIVSHATIYGKKSSRPLTSYEVAINQASIQLALADSSLLVHKGKLFDLAKKKLLEEGYQYKRGKSRSKLTIAGGDSISANSPALWPNDTSSSTPPPLLHHHKHAIKQSHQRQLHIEHLEKQLDHVRQSIINETSTAATTMDHPPQSSSESLQTIKTDLVKKIGKLKAQERKHQWYKRKTHLQHQQQQQQQQCQQQMLPSLEALEPCVDNSRPLLLPLPSPPQKSHAFFSSSSSSSSLPSPPGCYHPMTVSSPPQSEVRAKVLTVRDCCNS
ncbi:hypothetical protein BCR42DRAFT_413274 [Absidia repens]|uniref:NAB co-repressor domain-containing protein n=1 Tax=Absidia repens TaxID=90262 RepID=A0A1X2IKS2_9FUNG|nr:hypothetical protein BCR42DRAFT_413274 [Absidia repens]